MSTIYNRDGERVGRGHNLAIVNRKAREYGGVARITVKRRGYGDKPGGYYGIVTVFYMNGNYAITDFADYSHALDWAYARRDSGKHSWYFGCIVDHNLYI